MNDITTQNQPSAWAGLLETFKSPLGQGLLSAAATGLAGAKRGQTWNNFGRALQGGLLGYGEAVDQQSRDKVRAFQFDQLKRQKELAELGDQFYKTPQQVALGTGAAQGAPAQGGFDGQGNYVPTSSPVGPTVANANLIASSRPSFDTEGYLDARMRLDPAGTIALRSSMAKETPFNKVDPSNFTPESLGTFSRTRNYADLVPRNKLENTNGVWVDPYSGQTVRVGPQDPNKPFGYGADGKVTPNDAFQRYELSRTRAGAPSVTVKNEVKTGESIAGQIGPMVKDSYTAAQGAVQTATAADQVLRSIQAGNLVTGPLAGQRIKGLQIAEAMGIGGRDATERLNNTRSAIQGLAQMTLQGRKQMSGQGAVTESESKLAERAMSGDIEMTATELRTLASAAKRAAQWTYNQHQTQLKNMRGRQDLAGMADFYTTAPFPSNSGPIGDINFEELQ